MAKARLENKSGIKGKPNRGWAVFRGFGKNCNHRRTATRQQGFCCSMLKQIPFDFSQTGSLLEDRILKIIQEWTALQAPRESTEPVKFRVSAGLCQLRDARLRHFVELRCLQ